MQSLTIHSTRELGPSEQRDFQVRQLQMRIEGLKYNYNKAKRYIRIYGHCLSAERINTLYGHCQELLTTISELENEQKTYV